MATTSGLTAFNLDLAELIEEAYERCGSELRTGYDMKTARRSLNMLTIEFANRGINLWTIEQKQIVLNTNQYQYVLPNDTIDILDMVTRVNNGTSNQSDVTISRISEPTWTSIPNKYAQGRPVQAWINRQTGQTSLTGVTLSSGIGASDTTIPVTDGSALQSTGIITLDNEFISYQNVVGNELQNCFRGQGGTTAASHGAGTAVKFNNMSTINVYPSPSAPGDQYTLVYYRMRRIQDAGGGTNVQDIPFRMIPALVAGLSFYLSQKIPTALPRMPMLKQEYEEQWMLASTEDRDKAPDRYVPRNLFYS